MPPCLGPCASGRPRLQTIAGQPPCDPREYAVEGLGLTSGGATQGLYPEDAEALAYGICAEIGPIDDAEANELAGKLEATRARLETDGRITAFDRLIGELAGIGTKRAGIVTRALRRVQARLPLAGDDEHATAFALAGLTGCIDALQASDAEPRILHLPRENQRNGHDFRFLRPLRSPINSILLSSVAAPLRTASEGFRTQFPAHSDPRPG